MDGRGMCQCPTGATSNHLIRENPHLVINIVVWILMLLLSGVSVGGFNSQCGFGDCWDLYQQAQEALRISDMYPLTWVSRHSLPAATMMPVEIEKRCTAFRTFYKCLATASRGCLGDLNFHSAHKGTEKQMNIYGCSLDGPVYEPQYPPASPLPLACTYDEDSSEDSEFESGHRICGMFGGLHLTTFDEEYQTCNVVGAWPMMDDEHFTIQVTSERRGLGSYLAKVTVVIKQDEECALADRYVLYQATSSDLPPTFSDGSTAFGAFDNIKLEEVEAGRHVSITMRHIDTVVWIHCVNQVLSIFVKTPDEFADSLDAKLNSVQLCFIGCPPPMQVDVKSFFRSSLARHHRPGPRQSTTPPVLRGSKSSTLPHADDPIGYEASLSICRSFEPGLKGYFLNSCIYDVMSSGDSGMAVLSAVAMNVTLSFDGRVDESEEFSDVDTRTRASGSSPSKSPALSTTIIILLLICIALNHSACEIFTQSDRKFYTTPSKSHETSKSSRSISVETCKNVARRCHAPSTKMPDIRSKSGSHFIPVSASSMVLKEIYSDGLEIVSERRR